MKENKFYYFALTCFFIILFLPLLNLPPWFTPPAWGKTIVFRFLLGLLFLVFLIKHRFNLKKIKESFSPGTKTFLSFWSLTAFFSITFLSTLFSLDLTHSLWGEPSRGGGFVNFFFYIVFFLLAFLLIKRQDWYKLLNFSLFIGLLASLVGLCQRFGWLENIFVTGAGRPSSLMGNPIIFSLYLLPLIFISLSLLPGQKSIIKKSLYLFYPLFYIFTIIFITQTRAAFLGIIAGFLWFLIAYPKKRKIFRLTAICLLMVIASSLFLLERNPQIYQNWPTVIEKPLARIATLAKGLEAETSRLYVWQVSMEAIKDRPVLGYGPENFSIAFDRYYDIGTIDPKKVRWFDRAHNSLIDILINSGVFALIAYIIFFASVFWALQKTKKEEPACHSLQAGFIAYLTAAFFSIEGFSNFLVLFLLYAFSFHLVFATSSEKSMKDYFFERKRGIVFNIVSLIIFIWFVFSFNLTPLKANTNINIAKEMAKQKNWQAVDRIMEQEIKKESFLSFYINSSYAKMLEKAPQEKNEILEKRISLLEENTKLKPNNTKNWSSLGELSRELAKKTKNHQIAIKAQEALSKAFELSPGDLSIITNFFFVSIEIKDLEAAKEKSEHCLKIYPGLKDCLWMSGLAEIHLGKTEEGKSIIKEAETKESLLMSQEKFLLGLITALASQKEYQETIPLHYELIELKPKKIEYKESLAFVLRELKEYQKAKELALEILKQSPKSKEKVEAFLETLE
jgi:O-antigen ligase